MITEGELEFFEKIKDDCKIIFDVGCKQDIHYIDKSKDKIFHYFEPNLNHYNVCVEKTKNIVNNTIHINPFGLGNKTEILNYWSDSESFFKRHFHYQSQAEPILLSIKRFSEYLEENKIDHIDFLKIDTEGCEPDILLDNTYFIRNSVKYIQFEYASTWVDRDDGKNFDDIFYVYKDCFEFYFLYNSAHPISKDCQHLLTPIQNDEDINIVNNYVKNAYGFEIVMIRGSYEI